MGAWGEQPKDNDGTGDLFDVVKAHAARGVQRLFKKEKGLCPHERWERLGVLQETLDGMPAIVGNLQDVMKQALYVDVEALLEDEEWLNEWRSPKKVVAALNALGKRLGRELDKL